MATMTGGCLCGKVRYVTRGEPLFQGVCHCTDCQKQGGTAFSVVVAFHASDLEVTGTTKTYTKTGTSGGDVKRLFCPECGSPILSRAPTSPGLAFLKGGTLDDTGALRPTVHVWCDSKQDWLTLPEDAVKIPKAPN